MREPHFQKEVIGNLPSLIVKGNLERSITLFHGYGASMEDLAPLAVYLQQVTDATLYFPNAPLEVGGFGYAWFPIDFTELERWQSGMAIRDLSRAFPAGFATAREVVDAFYAAICKRHKNNIIGGFSQGAMVTTDLMLRSKNPPLGLLILSGTLVAEKEWRALAMNRAGYRFFQSHGQQDMILPYFLAQRLNQLLHDCGLEGELLSFAGGHEIPPLVISAMLDYIATTFANVA